MPFLKNLFKKIIDIIFPKYCFGCNKVGTYICNYCLENKIQFMSQSECHVCEREIYELKSETTHSGCEELTDLSSIFSAVRYSKIPQKLLFEVKYNFYFDLVNAITDIMLVNLDLCILNNSILVPIPLHRSKYFERGFNQAELIAKQIVAKSGKKAKVVNLINRRRNTKTQVGMTKEERQFNLNNAFEINPDIQVDKIQGKKVILVDDVFTTGTTLERCSEVLKSAGFKNVCGLVFARA